jgi:hypothetical protein
MNVSVYATALPLPCHGVWGEALLFWPTHANCHALADLAGHALSTDAWQLAWVGQKCRQNQLVMVKLFFHGESGSSMFCGCGMAIV